MINTVKVRQIKSKDDFFEINEKLAGVVPMALPNEQIALNRDIAENGQREPIVLYKGKIVDGRCRQTAIQTVGLSNILYKELDDELTEDEVKIFVKSINTRRNLTYTQKLMVACRESLKPNSKNVKSIAEDWGVSKKALENARYIAKKRPEFIEILFNGGSVKIADKDGNEKDSNKVSTIYAHIKREEENTGPANDFYGWSENSMIKTQAAKEWYYDKLKNLKANGFKDDDSYVAIQVKISMAELANFKFDKTLAKAIQEKQGQIT